METFKKKQTPSNSTIRLDNLALEVSCIRNVACWNYGEEEKVTVYASTVMQSMDVK